MLSDEIAGYDYAGRDNHIVQYLQKEICNICDKVLEFHKQGKRTEKHTFANGYCIYCNGEEPLFLQDELPTGRYINEDLDGRLDYFIENLSDRGAQSILERLIKEIEVMENSKKGTQPYADAKENALGLIYQLKMSFEYQCDVRISDAYKPYHDFMAFVDQWKLMKYVGIYGEIETDPGFCTMVDVALNSYEISSETFKAALAYAKTFNSTFTYDMIGVVDIGIASGLVTEVFVTGVTTPVSKVNCSFKDDKALLDHYNKHKNEFSPNMSVDEYLERANKLINRNSTEVFRGKRIKDGATIVYDKVQNEFLVWNSDGTIATFFKPSAGELYYLKQFFK